jgi:hypothetical protein
MDAATWNDQRHQMLLASERSSRMAAAFEALDRLATEMEAMDAGHIAAQLRLLSAECFHLAALAQSRAAEISGALEDARDAGEEPS